MSPVPTVDEVMAALATVLDPEINRPITDLGMVDGVEVRPDGTVRVQVLLTTPGCPLKDKINTDVTAAVGGLPGVTAVEVPLGIMNEDQLGNLKSQLRGGRPEKSIPFSRPDSLTRIYAIASGKGGVGKSSITVNLAAAMAADGLKVGVVDADIYGHSIPGMLGTSDRPTRVSDMIMPPQAHGVKVISIGMFTENNQPVVWRGPMLHRALQQFLADVYWGDLDVLLLDLPPGTGDMAISVAQLVPTAEIVVVTTPQRAAADVAERAGAISTQTHQRVVGVIENMSGLPCPHCGELLDVFGSGGGRQVAEGLTRLLGTDVPVLAEIQIDPRLRAGADAGQPLVITDPDAPAAKQLRSVAGRLGQRSRGLVRRPLSLTPVA